MLKIISSLIALVLVVFISTGKAQENPASTPSNDKVEQLQKKVDEHEREFKLLQETLRKQSEIIERQQKQLESLQSKIQQKETGSTVASTVPSQPDNANTATNQTAEVKPAPKPSAKPANNVESGFGKVRFNGLLQGWFAAGNGGFNDTVRIRRAELKLSGDITPKARWTVMFDPAKALSSNNTFTTVNGTQVVSNSSPNQASRILQDAFITLSYINNVTVDIGQYKIPLSQEGLQSSAALDTVDRALFMSDRSRGGGLGDIRDIGVTFRGGITKNADYQIGFFNGVGENQNDTDRNDQKAVIGRFVVRPPFIKGLQIGASGAWGNGSGQSRRDRLGGEAVYTRDKFKFKTEVMGGVDGEIHRLGFYQHFGYRFAPKLEGIFRFDSWDPDRRRENGSANVTERDYIVGLNYYINENNLKLQLNYLRKTFNNGVVPSRNLFLVNLQTAW